MLLPCTNKGCFSSDHHQLDPDTNEVHCLECGEVIKNIPRPTKTVLKSLGQIKRKSKAGMQYTCNECGNSDKPLLKKLSGGVTVAACRKCSKKLDIHPSFIQAMSDMEGYSDEDEGAAEKQKAPSVAPTPGSTFVVAGSE